MVTSRPLVNPVEDDIQLYYLQPPHETTKEGCLGVLEVVGEVVPLACGHDRIVLMLLLFMLPPPCVIVIWEL